MPTPKSTPRLKVVLTCECGCRQSPRLNLVVLHCLDTAEKICKHASFDQHVDTGAYVKTIEAVINALGYPPAPTVPTLAALVKNAVDAGAEINSPFLISLELWKDDE
jgi:hypothetical protein